MGSRVEVRGAPFSLTSKTRQLSKNFLTVKLSLRTSPSLTSRAHLPSRPHEVFDPKSGFFDACGIFENKNKNFNAFFSVSATAKSFLHPMQDEEELWFTLRPKGKFVHPSNTSAESEVSACFRHAQIRMDSSLRPWSWFSACSTTSLPQKEFGIDLQTTWRRDSIQRSIPTAQMESGGRQICKRKPRTREESSQVWNYGPYPMVEDGVLSWSSVYLEEPLPFDFTASGGADQHHNNTIWRLNHSTWFNGRRGEETRMMFFQFAYRSCQMGYHVV